MFLYQTVITNFEKSSILGKWDQAAALTKKQPPSNQ